MDKSRASWAAPFLSRPSEPSGLPFSDYAPAVRLGYHRFREDTLFEDVCSRLSDEWEEVRGTSRLSWLEARHAVQAAWERAAARGQSWRGSRT